LRSALASVVTGSNRVMLSVVFPALSFLGLVLVALLVIAQSRHHRGGGVFRRGLTGWGQVHLTISARVSRRWAPYAGPRHSVAHACGCSAPTVGAVIGVPFSPIEQPRLALLVQQIAKATNARMPDNIVLGSRSELLRHDRADAHADVAPLADAGRRFTSPCRSCACSRWMR
jgi:hypothetical protein